MTSAGPASTTSPSPESTSPPRTSTREPGLMPSFFGSGVPLYPALADFSAMPGIFAV